MSNYRYSLVKGDTFNVSVVYKIAATAKDVPAPVDMTGWSASLAVKWPAGSVLLDSTDGEIAIDTATGEIVCDPIDSSPFPVGEQTSYQLRVKDTLDQERTLLSGTIRVAASALEAAGK